LETEFRSTVTISVLDLCSYLGLAATGFATLTLWLGLLISLRYSPQRYWPHRHVNLFSLHQWSAYATVLFMVTHPVVLLFQHAPRFRLLDLVWPLHSPLQPKLNCAGAGALYLLVVVLGTSLLRHRMSRPLWRRLHTLAFPAVVLVFLHSILTDPLLKDGKPDLLDGGKVFVEIACLLSVVAVVGRIVLRGKGLRPSAGRRPLQS
jgi:predicted ferric reductase